LHIVKPEITNELFRIETKRIELMRNPDDELCKQQNGRSREENDGVRRQVINARF
jgi:hypothetical protein